LLPGARVRAVKEAAPALASAASGQAPSRPALHARTRHSRPYDPSAARFAEERYFRRKPLHDFERDEKFSLSQPTR
jgi:hypothetical protein